MSRGEHSWYDVDDMLAAVDEAWPVEQELAALEHPGTVSWGQLAADLESAAARGTDDAFALPPGVLEAAARVLGLDSPPRKRPLEDWELELLDIERSWPPEHDGQAD